MVSNVVSSGAIYMYQLSFSIAVLQHRIKVLLVFVVCVFMIASYCIEGPHQQVIY